MSAYINAAAAGNAAGQTVNFVFADSIAVSFGRRPDRPIYFFLRPIAMLWTLSLPFFPTFETGCSRNCCRHAFTCVKNNADEPLQGAEQSSAASCREEQALRGA
jgi:hypothetical protein